MGSLYSNEHSLVTIKDRDSKFISMSPFLAKIIGANSAEHMIGKTDYDLPCEASKFASRYIEQDRKVFLSKKELITLDIQYYNNNPKILLTNRKPLLDQNECTHISTSAIDVSETILGHYYFNLFEKNAATYILNSDHCPLPLTQKQEICLFHMIRGKSIKQIAMVLKISPRTVEGRLERIKDNLRCQTKQELIEKTIHSGFLYYLPYVLRQ